MYDRLIFYNHFGVGDIFESREFVKEWINLVPAKEYFYSHGKSPKVLQDIPQIQFKEITHHMDPKKGAWDDLNGNLYVNTWIGRNGKYVLPGIGCTVEMLFKMHNDMLGIYNLGKLSGNVLDYIPRIDYLKYDLSNASKFLRDTDRIPKVYIDNGIVQSNQAENFPMNPIIEDVAKNNPQKIFITTQETNSHLANIYSLHKILGEVGFDLYEASFLSLACDVLVGRNSGPHVFTQVYENVMNSEKTLLSFTYHQQGSSFVVNTNVRINKVWSPATNKAGVIQEIERVIL